MITPRSKKNIGNMCANTYCQCLVISVLLSLTLVTGCEQAHKTDLNNKVNSKTTSKTEQLSEKIAAQTSYQANTHSSFAAVVDDKRQGKWLGGTPPMNKRASGISTYYRLKAGKIPNQLTMTLRFEGIIADDARVNFRAIDGAKFTEKNQQTEWQLAPNKASQISFNIIIPNNASYLTLETFQQNKSATRAFLLELPKNTK